MRFLALDLFAANNITLKAGGTSVGDRYFSATAQGQRLSIEGMGEHNDMEPSPTGLPFRRSRQHAAEAVPA